MKLWIITALASLALPHFGCSVEEPQPAQPPEAAGSAAPLHPNLLLITLDTTRADALGTYGQPLDTSPNFDRLAARGVLFEQVTTSNPETLPSHSTIFTGRWPYVHGVRANAGYLLAERNVTLAEVLRSHGYRTGAEIAAPVLRKETLVTQGFDHYRGTESPGVELKVVHYLQGHELEQKRPIRLGRDISARGIEFIRENRDQSFFLWLHYFDAHNPRQPPDMFVRKIPTSPYHAEVAGADFQVALVLRELERLGLDNRTLIVITADHGEGLLDHGEPSHSYFVYDSVMRVPWILAGLPQLPKGLRVRSLVRTVDLAPTVLDLLGQPPLEDVDGVSLAPLLEGAEDLELTGYGESIHFMSTFDLPVLRFIRRGPWKYIHKVNPELYDVVEDPGELDNRADRHPEIVSRLRADLEEMLSRAPEVSNDSQTKIDRRTAAQLIALGYVAGSPAVAIGSEVDSLEVYGDDPVTKVPDIQAISKGLGLIRRGEYERALEEFLGLRERNPDSTVAMDHQAEALQGLDRHAEAIALLQRVLTEEPGNSEAAYSLARSLKALDQGDQAADLLYTLLERDPCDERVRLDQNKLLVELGRREELLGVLREGAERCPEMLTNSNNYAWALATLPEDHLRDGEEALRVIRAVIAEAPSPSPVYQDTLAAALAERGDFEEAVRTGERLLSEHRSADGAPAIGELLEAHLEAYRARRPIRDPSPEAN